MSILELPESLDEIQEVKAGAGGEAASLSIGRIVGFVDGLRPVIMILDVPDRSTVVARTMVHLGPDDLGRDVVIWTRNGSQSVIVLGKILGPSDDCVASQAAPLTIEADGDRILLAATKTISLRCGKASVTLGNDGSVIIEGARICTRSTGVNRITGAIVHIN